MSKFIRIGIDTSKTYFQLHCVQADEGVVRRKLHRNAFLPHLAKLEPTMIGIEACGSAHYWAREIEAVGHKVVLIPPQFITPYVDRRNKNDRNDSEAISEVMIRPKYKNRFVPHKTIGQQTLQMLMSVREGLINRRTQVSNTLRGHASEFGLVRRKGLKYLDDLLTDITDNLDLPEELRQLFFMLQGQYRHVDAQIREIDARLMEEHRNNEMSQRLTAIPGVGPIGAMMLTAKAIDVHRFKDGRDFAAWAGLTPRDRSTGGKSKQGGITRAGDEMLRATLVLGATSVLKVVRAGRGKHQPAKLVELARTKKPKLAAVALANKNARIAWKLMTSGEKYQADHVPTAFRDRGCGHVGNPAHAGADGDVGVAHMTTATAAATGLC